MNPIVGRQGSAVITLTVSDGNGGTSSTSFSLTVTGDDDPPVVSQIADRSIPNGTTSQVPFTVTDDIKPSSQIFVAAFSSDETIIKNTNLVVNGIGESRTLSITPSKTGGPVVITLLASDGFNNTTEQFTVTVLASAPSITAIADQVINEDTSTSALPFTIGDPDTPVGSLVVSAASSNQAIVPNANVVLAGTGANRTVTVTPAANANGGPVAITVSVSDGTSLVTETFDVTVTPVNDPPTISSIADVATNEDTATGPLAFTVGDIDTPLASLTITATSSNQALVPNANIVLAGTGANRTVNVTPAANANGGPATITVTVNDGTASVTETFDVTVTPVNDPPTISAIADVTTNEDTATGPLAFTLSDLDTPLDSLTVTATSSNQALVPNANIVLAGTGANRTVNVTPAANANGGPATITVTVNDGTSSVTETFDVTVTPINDPPTISAITDVITNEDTATGPLAFTVGDAETPLDSLTITATSSNQALVPNANIVLAGTGANRTVNVTPAANANGGPATITLTVSDGTTSVTETFDVTVTPVNDPPTISAITDVTTNEDTATGPLAFTLSDLDTPLDSLTVSATSSNQALVPNANIVLAGTGANRTVNVTPAANANGGPATITVTVNDGTSSVTETFDVTVTPINDSPTISAITDVITNEDTATGPLAFTVGDAETPLDSLTITATSSDQALVPNGNIVLAGTGANRTVNVTPAANANGGPATITVTVSDGTASATETFDVTVTPVDDLPTISAIANVTINEDTATGPLAFTLSDLDTPLDSLTVSATSSNQALVPNGNIVLAGTGANRTVNVTPAANANGGPATITVTVNDGTSSVTETFDVTVRPINDSPTISAIADVTTNEDTATGPLAFTVGDLETPLDSLTITATSSNQALVPNANIVLAGTGANRTVNVTPAANANGGPATITLTVSDGTASVTETFDVTVTPVNDPPTISDIGNQFTPEDTPTAPIPFSISDVETTAGSLVVTATSSNTDLVPNGNITLGGTNGNRTISLTPLTNQSGITTITVTVSDGTTSTSDTFVLNVGFTDDPPAISTIADVTINEDTATGPLAFTVSDPDTPLASLTITATSSNQALVPNGNIVLNGSGANRTVNVTPAANANGGPATITLTVSDGTSSAIETFDVTVAPVNDPPTISQIADQTVRSGASTGPIPFTVADIDTAAATLSVTATSDNAGLIPVNRIVLGGSGANRSVTITPLSGKPGGTVQVTLTVSDGGTATASESFSVVVTPAVIGDSNNDGLFNSDDMVVVFQAGEYEDEIPGNSTWEEGDWNGDGDFNSDDMVYAFQAGIYEVEVASSSSHRGRTSEFCLGPAGQSSRHGNRRG